MLRKANRMFEFLMWDPAAPGGHTQRWSRVSMPLSLKWLNSPTTDSSWEVFKLVDHLMNKAGNLCRILIFWRWIMQHNGEERAAWKSRPCLRSKTPEGDAILLACFLHCRSRNTSLASNAGETVQNPGSDLLWPSRPSSLCQEFCKSALLWSHSFVFWPLHGRSQRKPWVWYAFTCILSQRQYGGSLDKPRFLSSCHGMHQGFSAHRVWEGGLEYGSVG